MESVKWPPWINTLKDHYLAGSASFFILHGNVDDAIGLTEGDNYSLVSVSDFLARQVFSGYDLVLQYDLGAGLRPHPGGDQERLSKMNRLTERLVGSRASLPRDPVQALRVLDRLVSILLVGGAGAEVRKTAFLFDYGEWVIPPGERYAERLVTLLNWARSPVVRRVNMLFIFMARSLSQVHPALVQSGYTTEIAVPMPDSAQRQYFIKRQYNRPDREAERLSALSAGLTLANLDNLMRLVERAGSPRETPATPAEEFTKDSGETVSETPPPAPTATPARPTISSESLISEVKKQLIESQIPGLIKFVEPDLSLEMVAGHTAAKQRLADDARLIISGELEAAPMGYLICGPVGVGKTFIAVCYAGTAGIPCVTIQNFRSKYVGETEGNLERILGVLRELGPVAVIIDEADAAVGDRGASGDSGTSARVFAQLAGQMGDTRYRGKIIWFLLTCRPDLLPIDLKRQGRCEEHIPLFYPETPEDRREMFLAMGRKLKIKLSDEALPDIEAGPVLSGADIEALLTRVRREAILRECPIDRQLIETAMKNFRSPRSVEHELQWLAAILECSNREYLPLSVRKVVDLEGGFDALTKRFRELRVQID